MCGVGHVFSGSAVLVRMLEAGEAYMADPIARPSASAPAPPRRNSCALCIEAQRQTNWDSPHTLRAAAQFRGRLHREELAIEVRDVRLVSKTGGKRDFGESTQP